MVVCFVFIDWFILLPILCSSSFPSLPIYGEGPEEASSSNNLPFFRYVVLTCLCWVLCISIHDMESEEACCSVYINALCLQKKSHMLELTSTVQDIFWVSTISVSESRISPKVRQSVILGLCIARAYPSSIYTHN